MKVRWLPGTLYGGRALSELGPELRETHSSAGVRLPALLHWWDSPPRATAPWTLQVGLQFCRGWLLAPVPSPPQRTRRWGPQIPLLLRRWSWSRRSCEASHGAGVGAGYPPRDPRRLRVPLGGAVLALRQGPHFVTQFTNKGQWCGQSFSLNPFPPGLGVFRGVLLWGQWGQKALCHLLGDVRLVWRR